MSKIPSETTQSDLETLFSKHQLLPVLREEFMEIAIQYPIESDHKFIAEMLSQMYLHRQCDPVTLVGILSPKYGEPQEVADKLLLMCDFDYLDFDMNVNKFMVKYDVTEDVQAMLDRYQYPLPMVVMPLEIKTNFDTGYKTIKESVVLNGSEYFNDKDMCLDHLNRANSVALTVDRSVLDSLEGKYVKPTRHNGEDFTDFKKRLKQASVFYDTSLEVMDGLTQLSDILHLTHKYDRRGRSYASGYHVNTQGTDYNKAVLQLANKELVNS